MDVVGRSRDNVEELLSTLESAYGGFPVNQTSVSVSSDRYDRAARRCRRGAARVDVHVRNERDEVLVVADPDGPDVPHVAVDPDDPLEARAREAVRAATGVEFAVDDLLGVTIAGVRDEATPDADTVYRLLALLAGTHVAGDPTPEGRWSDDPPPRRLLV